jgi:hypothetical protein
MSARALFAASTSASLVASPPARAICARTSLCRATAVFQRATSSCSCVRHCFRLSMSVL